MRAWLLLFLLIPAPARAGGAAVVAAQPGGGAWRNAAVVGSRQAGTFFGVPPGLGAAGLGRLAPGLGSLAPSLASVYAAVEKFKASAFAGAVRRFTAAATAELYEPSAEVRAAAAALGMPERPPEAPKPLPPPPGKPSMDRVPGPDDGPQKAAATGSPGEAARTARAQLSRAALRLGALKGPRGPAAAEGTSSDFDGSSPH